MEFDQILFKKLFRFYRRKTAKSDPEVEARTVQLEPLKPRLTILARALSGAPIDIITSQREGGWKGNKFFLPVSFSKMPSLEDNLKFFLFRILYLSAQKELNLNWEDRAEHTESESQTIAKDTSEKVLKHLWKEYPSVQSLYEYLKNTLEAQKPSEEEPADLSWLYGRWMQNELARESRDQLQNFSSDSKKAEPATPQTEIKAKPSDEVKSVQVDKKAQQDFVLTHNFEKVETTEEFQGIWRNFDGEDSLEEDAESLKELNLKHTVRVDDMVHSVYQAEFAGNLTVMESADGREYAYSHSYPEWDYQKKAYKYDFCKVYHQQYSGKQADYIQQTLQDNNSVLLGLRKKFARLHNRLEAVKRLNHGEDIDIDALVDMQADIRAQHTPSDKVYISKRKRKKDISLLFLLDISLSSDAYAAGNRILDVEKQVVILLGEVLDEYDIEFQVDGFFSKTRNYCSYLSFKTFDEKWSKRRDGLGAVSPKGYTRIGPALRHAGKILEARRTRNKWVILLSDGKPNDYDKYSGTYGIADVRKALLELEQKRIHSYALAIEDQARYYLPQMFGNNHYNILTKPVELLHAMVQLYQRIEKA